MESVLSEEDRIAHLQKQIRATKRNQNIGFAALLVGVFGVGPVLAGVAESHYYASKYGGESQYSVEFTILLMSIWVALFVLGLYVTVHYARKLERLKRN